MFTDYASISEQYLKHDVNLEELTLIEVPEYFENALSYTTDSTLFYDYTQSPVFHAFLEVDGLDTIDLSCETDSDEIKALKKMITEAKHSIFITPEDRLLKTKLFSYKNSILLILMFYYKRVRKRKYFINFNYF